MIFSSDSPSIRKPSSSLLATVVYPQQAREEYNYILMIIVTFVTSMIKKGRYRRNMNWVFFTKQSIARSS